MKRSVVVCGSARFKDAIFDLIKELEELNVQVYSPYLTSFGMQGWGKFDEIEARLIAIGLTRDHFAKICMADIVYIYNKDGYAGNSTSMEIGAAAILNKPIYCFDINDPDLTRRVLFRAELKTAQEILSVLSK